MIGFLKRGIRLFYQRPTEAQRAVAELELPNWRFDSSDPANGYVVLDGATPSASYALRLMMTARAYGKLQGLVPLIMCPNGWSFGNPWVKIYRALGVRDFAASLPYRLNPVHTIANLWRAWRVYRSLRTPEDLQALQYGGITIGDLVYDDVLRLSGAYTIDRIDRRLFPFLYKAIRTFHYFERLLDRYPIKAGVLSHTCYSPYGIPFKLMLQRGIPVHNDVRRFTSFEQRPYLCYVLPPRMLDDIERKVSRDLALVDEELEFRFSAGTFTSDLGTLYAYKGKPKVSEEELRRELGLDPRYPIVTIMAHCFSDACHYGGWGSYRDLYAWLVDTLRYANGVPGVNWILKPHPSASLYGEDAAVERLFRDEGLTNIKLLRGEYHTLSIAAASHALVTCIGSCGGEYAHLGVPSIMAGQNAYTECGFTINAPTREEYYALLRNVASLPRLTADQQRRAKVYNFFKLVMMSSMHSEFYAPTDENLLGDTDGSRSERMLREMHDKLQRHSPDDDLYYQRVVRGIRAGLEYMMDPPDEIERGFRQSMYVAHVRRMQPAAPSTAGGVH